MKVIIASPVKNEEWVLPSTLKNFSSFADYIILADQNSTDKTSEVCKNFPKVKVIPNNFKGYTNEVRFMLLDEARKIEGNNLIVCLDADEQISPKFIDEIKNYITNNPSEKSVGFFTKWLQIYGKQDEYRIDEPWRENYKTFVFLDNRKVDYNRTYITNEHIGRIPETDNLVELKNPIIHLQWLARKRSEIKQAVYMCTELVDGWNPRKTNNRYSVARFLDNVPVEKVKPFWMEEIYFPSKEKLNSYDKVKLQDIYTMFDTKGTLFFEPLDIWHIEELRERFEKENHRKPTKIKVFPSWLIYINTIKNNIKNKTRIWLASKR